MVDLLRQYDYAGHCALSGVYLICTTFRYVLKVSHGFNTGALDPGVPFPCRKVFQWLPVWMLWLAHAPVQCRPTSRPKFLQFSYCPTPHYPLAITSVVSTLSLKSPERIFSLLQPTSQTDEYANVKSYPSRFLIPKWRR